MITQWQNNPREVNIQKTYPEAKQTQGVDDVKFTNISNKNIYI